jgi:very-short-patch-repair endonuclease
MCGVQFRRQQVIDGFIVDFYCHAARLVVELDGTVHERRIEYDVERDQTLAARGRMASWYCASPTTR